MQDRIFLFYFMILEFTVWEYLLFKAEGVKQRMH